MDYEQCLTIDLQVPEAATYGYRSSLSYPGTHSLFRGVPTSHHPARVWDELSPEAGVNCFSSNTAKAGGQETWLNILILPLCDSSVTTYG